MAENRPPTPKELGYYFTLAQVGVEMVAPIGLGLALDHYFGWKWGTVGGAIFGFIGGMVHLVLLLKQDEDGPQPGSKREEK